MVHTTIVLILSKNNKGIHLQDAKAEHCFSAVDFSVLSNDGYSCVATEHLLRTAGFVRKYHISGYGRRPGSYGI